MLIAITGGIGMGKSTILSQFQGLGAKTLDADDVAHDMYLPDRPAYATLLQHWGNDILAQDGTLDRKKIAGIVFQSKEELAWLNSVMHPLVRNAIQDCANEDARPLFCAIPLLFESGWEETADKIISVWCDRETQMQRLIARADGPVSMQKTDWTANGRQKGNSCWLITPSCPAVPGSIWRTNAASFTKQ